MVHGCEGTKRCPIYMGLRFGPFCVLLLEKINKMLLCVKNHANMCLSDVLTWKL